MSSPCFSSFTAGLDSLVGSSNAESSKRNPLFGQFHDRQIEFISQPLIARFPFDLHL
jgi:hypothetical protein